MLSIPKQCYNKHIVLLCIEVLGRLSKQHCSTNFKRDEARIVQPFPTLRDSQPFNPVKTKHSLPDASCYTQ